MNIRQDSTGKSIYFVLLDPVTGEPATGLTAADVTLAYVRDRAAAVAVVASDLAAADSAWSAGGFFEVSVANAPGMYRIDWPDAAFESGTRFVQLVVSGANVQEPTVLEVELVAYEPANLPFALGPLVGSRNPVNALGVEVELEMFQREAKTFQLTVQDSTGEAIDLTDKTLEFTVQSRERTPVQKFAVTAENITLQGDNNEIAAVAVSAADSDLTATSSGTKYGWRLWDTAADEVLLYGTLNIVTAVAHA